MRTWIFNDQPPSVMVANAPKKLQLRSSAVWKSICKPLLATIGNHFCILSKQGLLLSESHMTADREHCLQAAYVNSSSAIIPNNYQLSAIRFWTYENLAFIKKKLCFESLGSGGGLVLGQKVIPASFDLSFGDPSNWRWLQQGTLTSPLAISLSS